MGSSSALTCSTPSPVVERFDELDAERLRELFVELDAELAGRDEPVRVLVAGGAALAFKWSDRSTYDVDLIGGDFPADVRRAIATVAERNNLEWHWINDGGTAGTAALEPHPRPLYVGQNFQAYSPDDRYLLAMKLFAARDRDFHDAVRLSIESGITSAEAMSRLIDDAYYHNVIPPEMQSFIEEVARTAARKTASNHHDRIQQPHSERPHRSRDDGELGLR